MSLSSYNKQPNPIASEIVQRNICQFIAESRGNSAFFYGPDAIDWDGLRWDLTQFFPKRGGTPTVAIFSKEAFKKDPFPDPFLEQAKALLAYHLMVSRDTQLSHFVGVLRELYRAFKEALVEPNIEYLNDSILRIASDSISQRSYPWKAGRVLEIIAQDYVEANRLSRMQLTWRSPFVWKNPRRHDLVKKPYSSGSSRENKLPDLGLVFDLSSVFQNPKGANDILTTAWFALAMFAPSRVTEILTLPVKCETYSDTLTETRFGLSWLPLKGAEPMTKWAMSKEWETLAKEAIERLLELGKSARQAAKWYEENPTKLFLPSSMEHLRGKLLTKDEVFTALGCVPKPSRTWLAQRGVKSLGPNSYCPRTGRKLKKPVYLYAFEEIERHVTKKMLPDRFPIADPVTGLKYSEALFTVPRQVMRENGTTNLNVPSFFTASMLSHDLGKSPSGTTIFWRHNLCDPSTGLNWKISTHQPRHLLNTLAQSKYVSSQLVAFWSGRKSVKQNDWYNHVPQEAILEAYVRLGELATKDLKVSGPLDQKCKQRSVNELISYEEALKQEYGAIHVTRFGICRHDYSLTPCPKDKDCINCGEHSFAKGDARQLEAAKAQFSMHQSAVKACLKAIADEEPGVERWLLLHREKMERWRVAVEALESPTISDGTFITLAPPKNTQTKSELIMAMRDNRDKQKG